MAAALPHMEAVLHRTVVEVMAAAMATQVAPQTGHPPGGNLTTANLIRPFDSSRN